jgi:hypothetical protein
MARKQSKVEKFTNECITATPEELDLMLDILKGVRGKRQPAKVRGPNKPKAVKPAAEAQAG